MWHHIGESEQPAAALALGKDLERGMVMDERQARLDHCIGER